MMNILRTFGVIFLSVMFQFQGVYFGNASTAEYQLVFDSICHKALRDGNDPVSKFLDSGLVSEDEFVTASIDALKLCPQSGQTGSNEHFWTLVKKLYPLATARGRSIGIYHQLDLVSIEKGNYYFGRRYLPGKGGRAFVNLPMTWGQLWLTKVGLGYQGITKSEWITMFPDLNQRDCLGFPILYYTLSGHLSFGNEIISRGADPTMEVPYVFPDQYDYILKEALVPLDIPKNKYGFKGYTIDCEIGEKSSGLFQAYKDNTSTIPIWVMLVQNLGYPSNADIKRRPQHEEEILTALQAAISDVPKDFFVELLRTKRFRLYPSIPSDNTFLRSLIEKGADPNARSDSGSSLLKLLIEAGFDGSEIQAWRNLGAGL